MDLGVQLSGQGIDGIAWHILGHTYVPMQRSEHSVAWHATFPDGTFVPPHIHRTQDEFIYMLEGKLQVDTGPDTKHAGAGDLIRLPLGAPHGLFNRSGAMVKCLFWVAPAARILGLVRRHRQGHPPGRSRPPSRPTRNRLPARLSPLPPGRGLGEGGATSGKLGFAGPAISEIAQGRPANPAITA